MLISLFNVQQTSNQELISILSDPLTLIQYVSCAVQGRAVCFMTHLMSSLICKWKEHNDPSTVCKYLKNLERGQTSPPGASAVHSTVGVSHTQTPLCLVGWDLHVDAVVTEPNTEVVFSFFITISSFV